ncbi:MAG: hypothetical protein ACRCWJ_11595 [Casimicrobium sp.]
MLANCSTKNDTAFTADQLLCGRALKFKGAKELQGIFEWFDNTWYGVGELCGMLESMRVIVHRDTLRNGLEQMCDSGFLERTNPKRLARIKTLYRRKLTDEQRQYRERERAKARNMIARANVANRIVRREARNMPQ